MTSPTREEAIAALAREIAVEIQAKHNVEWDEGDVPFVAEMIRSSGAFEDAGEPVAWAWLWRRDGGPWHITDTDERPGVLESIRDTHAPRWTDAERYEHAIVPIPSPSLTGPENVEVGGSLRDGFTQIPIRSDEGTCPTCHQPNPNVMWVCFHCDAEFTEDQHDMAEAHFGKSPDALPACVVDAPKLREMEDRLAHWTSRATRLEGIEESYGFLQNDLQARFGTTSPWEIADRMDNERFRADHAMKLLDAAGIPFDSASEQSRRGENDGNA